ncbi:MAG: hypothetical protein WCG75_06890 [Armatimonadota bacterium]
MTYDDFVNIALELPSTEEAMGTSGPSLNREGQSMFWLKKGVLLCIKMSWDDIDDKLDRHPEVLYTTPHFNGYPALHAHLDLLSPELAGELIHASWNDAPNKVKFRRQPKS